MLTAESVQLVDFRLLRVGLVRLGLDPDLLGLLLGDLGHALGLLHPALRFELRRGDLGPLGLRLLDASLNVVRERHAEILEANPLEVVPETGLQIRLEGVRDLLLGLREILLGVDLLGLLARLVHAARARIRENIRVEHVDAGVVELRAVVAADDRPQRLVEDRDHANAQEIVPALVLPQVVAVPLAPSESDVERLDGFLVGLELEQGLSVHDDVHAVSGRHDEISCFFGQVALGRGQAVLMVERADGLRPFARLPDLLDSAPVERTALSDNTDLARIRSSEREQPGTGSGDHEQRDDHNQDSDDPAAESRGIASHGALPP